MPWIPEGARPNLLAVVPASQWNSWADGARIGPAPHQQPPKAWGMRLNTSFSSANGINYKAGMQGRLLEVSGDKKMAKVYIEGVTEVRDYDNQWIPTRFVDKGQPWEFDIAKWRLDVRLVKTAYNTHNWNSAAGTDTTVLGRTITLMLSACRSSPPPFAAGKLTKFFGRNNIAVVGGTIIKGIQKAGLYAILSSSNAFSAHDLVNAAQYKISGRDSSDKGGVYARFHLSDRNVSRWKPESSYGYVGKTGDMSRRFVEHKNNKASYGDLTRNSKSLNMIALCILHYTENDALFYLTEQIFLCLLQCYKEEVLRSNDSHPEHLKFREPARYFTDIADEVFRMTGWQGGVSRQSFQIAYGANCSSPLLEYGNRFDRFLYIRTDRFVKDEETAAVIPVAFYRRADRVKVAEDPPSWADKKGTKHAPHTTVLSRKIYDPDRVVIGFKFTRGKKETAADIPFPGTPYQLVFEVRKDGSAHPYAWARLPEVGRYENFRQANSFAVRIEWEHPPNSGKWRFKYLQAQQIYQTAVDSVPGALAGYAKAISFLQWLTGSKPNHNIPWIHRLPGAAHVLQANYNFMDQSIVFTKPTDDITMLSCRVRPEDTIIAHMRDPKFGLDRVNGKFGDFAQGRQSKRTRCDTCVLLSARLSSMKMSDAWDGSCVQIKNTRVCTNCRTYGRPCCSWTSSLPSGKTSQVWSPSELKAVAAATSALMCLPSKDIPSDLQSFTQELRALESSSNMEDDGDDCKDEEQEDAIDEV